MSEDEMTLSCNKNLNVPKKETQANLGRGEKKLCTKYLHRTTHIIHEHTHTRAGCEVRTFFYLPYIFSTYLSRTSWTGDFFFPLGTV